MSYGNPNWAVNCKPAPMRYQNTVCWPEQCPLGKVGRAPRTPAAGQLRVVDKKEGTRAALACAGKNRPLRAISRIDEWSNS